MSKINPNDNKAVVSSYTPTFLLRSIDPIKVLNDYLEGKFNNLAFPTDKIKVATNMLSLAPQHGSTPNSEIYTYRDKTNSQQVIATTNHYQYSIVQASNGKELPIAGRCLWCLLDIEMPPIGIPVMIQYNNDEIIFHVDGCYCTFECCYSGLLREKSASYVYRDPLYMDSEQLLKLMYKIMYPNEEKLKKSPDWRLLKENNGCLDRKEFFNGSHTYERTSNLVILPIKVEYTVKKTLNS